MSNISLEEKINFIKKYWLSDELLSLDDEQELKQEIKEKLEKNELSEDQIDVIYRELLNIKEIEDKTLTPEFLENIQNQVANEKFEKVRQKIKEIYVIAMKDHLEEIKQAEIFIKQALWI